MKHFKKKTLVLILASALTVVGSFAQGNYKNNLTGLLLNKADAPNGVNITLQTSSEYIGNITPIRRDANTYIITLPEVNSKAITPNLNNVSGNISSVDIRTMPYSNGAKGYTRITIKTFNKNVSIATSTQVFLPAVAYKNPAIKDTTKDHINESIANKRLQERNNILEKRKEILQQIAESEKKEIEENLQDNSAETTTQESNVETTANQAINQPPQPSTNYNSPPVRSSARNRETMQGLLYALMIILSCSFFYFRAKNKMREILGNDLPDKEDTQESVKKKIKKTVDKIDSTYTNNLRYPSTQYKAVTATTPIQSTGNKKVEDLNIIDLDELFKEQNNTPILEEDEEENLALEDFLSGFSFEDSEEEEKEE